VSGKAARRAAAVDGVSEAAHQAPPPPPVLIGHAASLTPYYSDTPRPSPRTNRTRRVPQAPPGVPAAAVDRAPEQQHASGARAVGGEAGAAHAGPPGAAAGASGAQRLFVGKLPSLHFTNALRPIEVRSDTAGAPGGTGAPGGAGAPPKLEVPSATRAVGPPEESPPTPGAEARGRPTRVRRPGAAEPWADEDCRALAPAELWAPGASEAAHKDGKTEAAHKDEKTAQDDGPGRARGRCSCAGSLGAGGADGNGSKGAGAARVLELGRALRDIISASRERKDLPARPPPPPPVLIGHATSLPPY